MGQLKGNDIRDQNASHLEKEENRKRKNENKKREINKSENKEKDKVEIDKVDFKEEAGQLKGDVIGDENKSHLEKEEK